MVIADFSNISWIACLRESLRQEIQRAMQPKKLENGEQLYEAGDPVKGIYQVIAGQIRLFSFSSLGKELVYGNYYPGDCFGDLGALDNCPHPLHALAVGNTTVAELGINEFKRFYDTYPEVREQLLLVQCKRIRTLLKYYEGVSLFPLELRFAYLLCDLAQSGQASTEGAAIELQLTQADIANYLGVSRQAVNQIIHQWEQSGIIHSRYRKLVIKNIGALQRLSSS